MEPEWSQLGGLSVLLVEDNLLNQKIACDCLQLVGMLVTVAGDGIQAIELLNSQSFDLVLMDILMPLMGGFEAAIEIRKNPRFSTLPIIAMTASDIECERARYLKAGMNDCIAKPIDLAQMFSVMCRNLLR